MDIRDKNVVFDKASPRMHLMEYVSAISKALGEIDNNAFEAVIRALVNAGEIGAKIFVAGNGGSAAISEHLCCDCCKGTAVRGHKTLFVNSLTCNSSLYSAIANDFGFEEVFSKQLEYFARKDDIFVAISSSGNSENILRAVEAAKALGMLVIGFSGFDGGKLKEISDLSLHVNIDNYGVIEDSHQILMHNIAQIIYNTRVNC